MRVFGPSHAHLRIRAIPSQLTTVQMLALDLLVEINSRLLSSFVSLLRTRRKVAGLVNRTEKNSNCDPCIPYKILGHMDTWNRNEFAECLEVGQVNRNRDREIGVPTWQVSKGPRLDPSNPKVQRFVMQTK